MFSFFCEFLEDFKFLEYRNNIFESSSLKAFFRQSFMVFELSNLASHSRYLQSVTPLTFLGRLTITAGPILLNSVAKQNGGILVLFSSFRRGTDFAEVFQIRTKFVSVKKILVWCTLGSFQNL